MTTDANVSAPPSACLRCAAELLHGDAFCPLCGMAVTAPAPTTPSAPAQSAERRCAGCRSLVGPSLRFCTSCGRDLAASPPLFGLFLLIGSFVYSHNSTFKEQCLIPKEGGPNLSFPKNVICALDFEVKPR